ncbi:MAG TPA: hypothetical protein VF796_26575 [Humisphaera sp.]
MSHHPKPTALRRTRALLAGVVAAIVFHPAASAMEVFVNTNSPAKASQGSQLFDRQKWPDAAKAIDGVWYVGQGMTKPPEGKPIGKARDQWIEGLKDKHWIVELQGRVIEAMGEGKHGVVHEVKAMKEGKVEGFSAMVYREDRGKDSTLTREDVAAAREGFKSADVPKTPLIVNTRGFTRNKHLRELVEKHLVDGFSVEVASNHVREGKIIEAELVPAVQFAVKHKVDVYLLVNAEHSAHVLEDVQDIYRTLTKNAGKEMASPHVRFVVSAYSAGKTQFTPDRTEKGDYANTTTGAALWLCDEADKHHQRGKPAAGK